MARQSPGSNNEGITELLQAIEQLQAGHYDVSLTVPESEPYAPLYSAITTLANTLHTRQLQRERLGEITTSINAGLLLEDILEMVYEHFKDVIPYNRIGFSLIDADGETVRAYWAKSDRPLQLSVGFTDKLTISSLKTVLETGKPRIIGDLEEYLRKKPTSISTGLVVKEGMRSSLTCPLINNGEPVGFLFFSSVEPHMYSHVHVDIFMEIAEQLSVILEKGRLVSQLAAQKEEIERTNAELVRVNELKSTFLGIATHDLRGPIGNIRMIADLLSDAEIRLTAEERASLIKDICVQSTHMLSLLNDLLDVTRIESGKLELRFETFSLHSFLTQLANRHAMMATPKGTKIVLEDFPDMKMSADPVRVRQVIDNLVSNAIKYSPPGSTVRIGAEKVPNGYRIKVSDEGPGITDEDRKNLFKDFAKLSAKPTGGEKSVGLGLAISRRIVEAHGGTIGVDSNADKSSTFWFVIPAVNKR